MGPPSLDRTATAFDTLADPVRIDVLRSAWLEGGQGEVSFSALRDAVDVDDSGRFNYHLQRLVGPFVEKTDGGYRLTPAGIAVVDTLYSGMLSPPDDVEPMSLETQCPTCGTELALDYDHGYMTVRCEGCEQRLSQFLFPPQGVLARESAAGIAAAFDAHVRSAIDRVLAGVCPYCAGRTGFDALADADTVPEGRVSFVAECADCHGRVTASAATLVSFYPAVGAFLHERGVDTRATLWEQDWYHETAAAVTDDDPPRVEVAVPVGGDVLELTIDGHGELVEVVGPD